MIAFKAKSLGLSAAPARLAGTPSRIPTAATMTWRTLLPARRRSPNSADTIRACAGCRATTTTATPHGSASDIKPSSTAEGTSVYDGIFARPLTLRAPGILRRLQFLGNAACLSRVTDSPLGLADQLGEASVAVDQRQVASVAIMLGGEQHRGVGSATAKYWRMPLIG